MVVLSQLHEKTAEFKDRLPDILRLMRDGRAFIRSVDPLAYYVSWGGALWSGIAALSAFASIGLLFKASGRGMFDNYVDLSHMTWPKVFLASVLVVGFYAGRLLLSSLGKFRNFDFREKFSAETQRENAELLASLDVGRLSDPEFKKLMSMARIQNDGYYSPNPFLDLYDVQLRLISQTVGLFASLGVIMYLDPLFIPFAILPVILELVKDTLEGGKRRNMRRDNFEVQQRMKEYSRCLTELHMLMQGKLLRFSDFWINQYREHQQEILRRSRALQWWDFKWGMMTSAAGILSLGLIIIYLGHRMVLGQATFTDVFFMWGGMQTLTGVLGGFGRTLVHIRDESIEAGYRQEFLSTKPLINESGATQYRFQTPPRVEMHNVAFRYPRTNALVLSDCSLAIAPGEKVALVGDNGSGKTTILRLLAKVYLPDEGTVTLDNIPTFRITQPSWFKQMLYSTQEKEVPDFIVEEALTGTLPGTSDMEKLRRAAGYSRADSFIENLPRGYQTQIGAKWDDGWEPSGGQEQRLKLTTAFYRLLEPSVHIGFIDEPMSECDIKTRAWFYQSLRTLTDKTVIVVAHDPVYLHCFDRVILIEHGRVAQELRTPGEIAEYQRTAVRRFEEEHKDQLRVVK